MQRARVILCSDGAAGLGVGATLVVFHGWIAEFYQMPSRLVLFVGAANVTYGCYSGWLATRAVWVRFPSRRAILALIIANATWVVVCGGILLAFWSSAGAWGRAHLVIEAVFVGFLSVIEYRHALHPAFRSKGARGEQEW